MHHIISRYLVRGIVFKLCTDHRGLYHGDEGAHKAGGHDQRSTDTTVTHRSG